MYLYIEISIVLSKLIWDIIIAQSHLSQVREFLLFFISYFLYWLDLYGSLSFIVLFWVEFF